MTSGSETILKVPVRGGDLAVARFGPAATERPTVLAVHPITANCQAWAAVARALGERASVYAVDLRGRGESRDLPAPYGMAAHVDDLLAVLDHLGIESVDLVGHSLGAYIAAQFAVEVPRRVRSVVLIDGGLTLPGSQKEDQREFARQMLATALARLNLTFATHDQCYRWWREQPVMTPGQFDDDDLVAFVDHDLVGVPPHLHSGVAAATVRADARDLAGAGEAARLLTVPAAMLCAQRGMLDELSSPMQPLGPAEAWAAESPRRSARLVKDVNHYTILFSPQGSRAVAETIVRLT